MNVLVDTSVWSLALRRKGQDLNAAEKAAVSELTELIQDLVSKRPANTKNFEASYALFPMKLSPRRTTRQLRRQVTTAGQRE